MFEARVIGKPVEWGEIVEPMMWSSHFGSSLLTERIELSARSAIREKEYSMGDKSGPREAVEGVVEGVKGKAKEVIGVVAGRNDVKREGQAQQDRGEAQREAGKKEAQAESARRAASASERRQKANQ